MNHNIGNESFNGASSEPVALNSGQKSHMAKQKASALLVEINEVDISVELDITAAFLARTIKRVKDSKHEGHINRLLDLLEGGLDKASAAK